jgi:NADPH2:quinone reductase
MVGGTYQVKPPFPFTPGLEAAGEIVETGSAVDGLQAGQRVLAVLRNVAVTPRKSCSAPLR